jgi:hypothetical protein
LVVVLIALVVAGSIAVPLLVDQLSADPSHSHGDRPLQWSNGASGAPTFDVPAKPATRVGAPEPQRPTSIVLPDRNPIPVEAARTMADGSLGVPRNIDHAGWWSGGSRLGDQFGAMVIGAHVDSTVQGLGPFSELLGSRPGDRVTVRSTQLTQTFRVTTVALIAKSKPKQVSAQFSGRGRARLVLVTCAGPYIKSHGGYQNIAVITAYPMAPASRR